MPVKRPPGPKGSFISGMFKEFAAQPHKVLLQLAKRYGKVAHFRLFHKHVYLMSDPKDIREVLVAQGDRFEKSAQERKILNKFMGNGLISSAGGFHKRQRELAQPAFHFMRISRYGDDMVSYTDGMLDRWEDGEMIHLVDEMSELTMKIATKTLFHAEVSGDVKKIAEAIEDLKIITAEEFLRGFTTPNWLPTEGNRRRVEATQILDEVIYKIMDDREAQAVDGKLPDYGDLLSMLMLSEDVDGNRMGRQELRDEVVTLFLTGHETSSNALSWTMYLLSQHPDVEAKLHEEVDRVLNGRLPTLADLKNLPYTLQVIKECMRIYPSAWNLNAREAQEDVQIGDYMLPKGSYAFVSPYVMHYDPDYFPDPERFDPERFTLENEEKLPRYVYIPFGAGNRICIGNGFAMMEIHLVTAAIVQRFRLHLKPGEQVEPQPRMTFSPNTPLPMRLEARTAVSGKPIVDPLLEMGD